MDYLKLIDTVYFFNFSNKTVSEYTIQPHGFIYCVSRYSEDDFYKHHKFILNNAAMQRLTEKEYSEFCLLMLKIQENVNSLESITPFEQYMQALRIKYNIQLKSIY